MPVFVKDEKSVLFAHVPKCGGTSLERMIRTGGWKMSLRETRKTHPRLMPLRRCSPQHYHAAILRELFDVGRFDYSFMVTRDPLRRFQSEYLMRNRNAPRLEAAAVDSWADRVLADYERNPYTLDNHLRPQHEYELPGAKLFRLEDGLEAVAESLNDHLGSDFTPPANQHLASTVRAGVSSSKVELSLRLTGRLRELYAEDFRRYGY